MYIYICRWWVRNRTYIRNAFIYVFIITVLLPSFVLLDIFYLIDRWWVRVLFDKYINSLYIYRLYIYLACLLPPSFIRFRSFIRSFVHSYVNKIKVSYYKCTFECSRYIYIINLWYEWRYLIIRHIADLTRPNKLLPKCNNHLVSFIKQGWRFMRPVHYCRHFWRH